MKSFEPFNLPNPSMRSSILGSECQLLKGFRRRISSISYNEMLLKSVRYGSVPWMASK